MIQLKDLNSSHRPELEKKVHNVKDTLRVVWLLQLDVTSGWWGAWWVHKPLTNQWCVGGCYWEDHEHQPWKSWDLWCCSGQLRLQSPVNEKDEARHQTSGTLPSDNQPRHVGRCDFRPRGPSLPEMARYWKPHPMPALLLPVFVELILWYSDMDRAKVGLVVHITNMVLNRVPISNDQPIFNHFDGIGKATEHASLVGSLVGPMSSSSTVLHIQ